MNRTSSRKRLEAALEAGRPPDFAFGILLQDYIGPWAVDDRLVDLSDTIGHFSDLFDPDALAWVTWRDVKTGQGALYGLPVGREINHVHVWKSLLKQAGFTVADIPREWEAFWSFWCDQVQPPCASQGREDIWGVALPMSVAGDTGLQFFQFVAANEADYVTPRRPARHRRSGDQAEARPGHRQLHGPLPQGLHPARLRDLERLRQQQGVPRADRRHDDEQYALDRQRA